MTDYPHSDDAATILVAGTASHVGKSVVTAGLARLLANRGVAVAPYKAQNMSNNARVVVSPEADGTGAEYGEIGISQYVQARAANVTPTTDMNPVLLKPRGDGESQLVIHGQAHEHLDPGAYYDDHWETARAAAIASHRRLATEYDVLVAEGAGSVAEINLQDRDLANVETARFADADVVLVGDIERGGVFASLYGTLELMPEDVREQVEGMVINKFRGTLSVLEPGIEQFEELTGVPVLGVLPADDPGLPAEDSVSLPSVGEHTVFGAEDGVPEAASVTVAVPRIPFISNFTDLEPLAMEPGVRVEYVPLDVNLAEFDAVVLPGSKNTVDDLLALQKAGFDSELRAFSGPIVGICGGYQMLGDRIEDAGIESTAVEGTIDALGVLPVVTTFSAEKEVTRTTCQVEGQGPIAGAAGSAAGYEIHMGATAFREALSHPLEPTSAQQGDVLGTYLHGLFENKSVREAFVELLFERAGLDRPAGGERAASPYERAATLLETNLDLGAVDGLAPFFD
ncbi:adenosylcobyric acid synthase [Halodesulfurarchaeum formicicum]|uniref:Probable cobyric acid synthase n=1 Tax=Halodesulfurarchaeum formicicum TaxID=1873524 RepID=A0A1D8S6E6_9EURY|nr:cobyric acid synthase [Halodesulfurarchaeum formicicum]AOW80933.1 adenosylcobyric acid synthase [Halodesulfurarchaeum formicicum]